MTYPIQITEHPHQGNPRTWVLENSEHLNKCLSFESERGCYTEWAHDAGLVVYGIDGDGEVLVEGSAMWTLEAYIDFLRHDLKALDIVENFDAAQVQS